MEGAWAYTKCPFFLLDSVGCAGWKHDGKPEAALTNKKFTFFEQYFQETSFGCPCRRPQKLVPTIDQLFSDWFPQYKGARGTLSGPRGSGRLAGPFETIVLNACVSLCVYTCVHVIVCICKYHVEPTPRVRNLVTWPSVL